MNELILRRAAGVVAMGMVWASLAAAQPPAPGTQPGGGPGPATTSRDISGYWELSTDSRNIPPASLVAGVTRTVLDARAKKDAHALRWCNVLGMPAMMDAGRPLAIQQDNRAIMIGPEVLATPRHLYLSRTKHIDPEVFDPTTTGDSIAHWEGDTLVVDTIGFDNDKGVTAIPGGGFRTTTSHLVERYRLLKNGAVLSVTFTWTDPKVFRTPHTYQFWYYRLPRDYEARQPLPCDAFDEERTQFLTGTPGREATAAARPK